MTDEMLELARANAAEAGVTNVEFLKGYIEDIPLPDNSVDVVISNCVINLAGDKQKVLAETARVLRPGGRFAVSDVIADPDMDEPPAPTCSSGPAASPARSRASEFEHGLARRGPDRRRDPRDPPRARARRARRSCGRASPEPEPTMTRGAQRAPPTRSCSRSARSTPPGTA